MHSRVPRVARLLALAGALAVVAPSGVRLVAQNPPGAEWRAYAGTNTSAKYSPLDQINKNTVRNLRIAWRQSATPVPARRGANAPAPTNYQSTPLMVGGLLYMSAGNGTVVALDAATGQSGVAEASPQPAAPTPRGNSYGHDEPGQPGVIIVSGRAAASRGLAYWTDNRDARVVTVVGQSLVVLNAKTGQRYSDFGRRLRGLDQGLDRSIEAYRWGGPPLVVGDVIVVGGILTTGGSRSPGMFVATTSAPASWFGRSTQFLVRGNSATTRGSTDPGNVRGPEASGRNEADDELGYVYLPTESAAMQPQDGDFYVDGDPARAVRKQPGGDRRQDRQARVALPVGASGLWDWDVPLPDPASTSSWTAARSRQSRRSRSRACLHVRPRHRRTCVADRGRPVPSGNVLASGIRPRSRFPPTPAYEPGDVTTDQLVDFTPELRAEALKIIATTSTDRSSCRQPSASRILVARGERSSGWEHTTTWNGAGVDPETGILYVRPCRTRHHRDGEIARRPQRLDHESSHPGLWSVSRRPARLAHALQASLRAVHSHRYEQGNHRVVSAEREWTTRSSRDQALEAARSRTGRPRIAAGHEDDGLSRRGRQ